jgi:dolichol-phosphate mannosyltransferase
MVSPSDQDALEAFAPHPAPAANGSSPRPAPIDFAAARQRGRLRLWSNGAASGAPTSPTLSIVIPTRNEAASIAPLLEALLAVDFPCSYELLFVDDSDDGTPQEIERLVSGLRVPVRYVHRRGESRSGGLGGAVVAGMRQSRAQWVAVMDSDLQHPPAVLPRMLQAAEALEANLVVGTRYRAGGAAPEFGKVRSFVSRGSTIAARALFPRALRGVSDPMSGLFLVRRERVPADRLRPRGFKILFEILVRGRGLRVAEVPYVFGTRAAGESNATLGEGMRFLRLLCELRLSTGLDVAPVRDAGRSAGRRARMASAEVRRRTQQVSALDARPPAPSSNDGGSQTRDRVA